MKKYFAIIIAFLIVGFSSPTSAQSIGSGKIFSFRGVLSGILKDIEEGAHAVVSEIKNPFKPKEPAPAAPPAVQANPENSFSFAIVGDTQRFNAGNPNGNFQRAAKYIAADNPDMVIAVGDLIGGCEGKSSDAKDYADWKKILGSLAAKVYAVQGNHDRVSDGGSCDEIWQNAFHFPTNGPSGFSGLTYSLDFKNSHFAFLDSTKPDGHQINDTQRAWLDQDLAKNKKENTFVVFHEPAWPTGAKVEESLDAQPGQRDKLWSIIKKYDVTAVFNGHEHIVSRRKIGNIYQFVFGDTDSFNHDLPKQGVAEFTNQGQGRFGLVSVAGKQITVKVFDPNNTELNSFTFSK